MSEMLANHYFMTRNFIDAEKAFQKILVNKPDNNFWKKRLMVCYTQTGNFENALYLFLELIKIDINFFTQTDIETEDCPYRDLIAEIESKTDYSEDFEKMINAGILWAYYDLSVSFELFKRAQKINPGQKQLSEILQIYEKELEPVTIIKRSSAGNINSGKKN